MTYPKTAWNLKRDLGVSAREVVKPETRIVFLSHSICAQPSHLHSGFSRMAGTPPTELFEPYERLIEINVVGTPLLVPENNAVLRCFQYINLEGISYGDFCWNADCTTARSGISGLVRKKSGLHFPVACV
ncbi:MAG TPA: hypothetical protein PLL06_03310 [Acidobacteriota bacterium]|nr:hypothetical protein [Acidobacteriota bacterium]